MRVFDDDHVLVLLGPEHLVTDSFWQAARVMFERNGVSAAQAPMRLLVPVVTTVPITQVTCAALSVLLPRIAEYMMAQPCITTSSRSSSPASAA